jgi:two-component system OmpR family response regulator
MAGARILVVDDERPVTDLLTTTLRFEGFEAEVAASGAAALRAAEATRPDLVLLDVMLPDLDGFEVQRRLAAGGARVPVIFLTARRAAEDRLRGLTIGADDYVTKPFRPEELVARIRAVLRRTRREAPARPVLRYADLELDEDAREVRRRGREIALTPTERNLLRHLLANPERVLSKAQILDRVWHYDFRGDSNVVETCVSSLRRKVDREPERLIHTVRGFGYVLRRPHPAG